MERPEVRVEPGKNGAQVLMVGPSSMFEYTNPEILKKHERVIKEALSRPPVT